MFTVDYEVGGAAQAHDHPFEETYFFLAGEVEAELDGRAHTLRPGRRRVRRRRLASTASTTRAPERVRWIETQAPQPPARHAYRWLPSWERVRERGVDAWPARQLRRRRQMSTGSRGRRRRDAGDRAGARTALRGRRATRSCSPAGRRARRQPRVAELSAGGRPRPRRSTSRTRSRSRRRWRTSGPVRRLALVAIDRDQNTVADYDIDRALRLVTLKLVGYTEVVHALLDRLTADASILLFGGMAKERPYPGSTTVTTVNGGVVGPDADARRGAPPIRVELDPPGRRRRQPVLGRQAGGDREVHVGDAAGPPGDDGRDRRRGRVPAREHGGQRRRPHRRRRLALPLTFRRRRRRLSSRTDVQRLPMSNVFRRSVDPALPVAVRAEGSTIWDADGRAYLDAAGGAIVVGIGHGRESVARVMAEQAGRVAYAHGTAFTSEPLERYAAALAPTCRWTTRRSTRCPAGPRQWNRRSSSPVPTTSPAASWSAGSSSPDGGATTATRSARWTCPGESRCAARTRRGWAGSGTSPPRTRTARGSRARTPSATPRSSPPSWSGPSRRPVPAPWRRSSPSRSSARRSPPRSHRTATGRRSPRSVAGMACC